MDETQESRKIAAIAPQLLVGSIDFGTTYSGWAYQFLHHFTSEPTKVIVKQWQSGSGTLVTEKVPTCILVRPDGETIEGFGYEAENKYHQLAEDREHADYYYFRRFKMALNRKLDETLRRNVPIRDEMGKELPAMRVFALAIKYLTDDLIRTCNTTLRDEITAGDIQWILTVPAIWSDSAKQFMREAAVQAGIFTERLAIALEPEAASIYCQYLPLQKTVSKTGSTFAPVAPGTKYLVLDAGGGTIDITVHEVGACGGLKEVLAASGGPWGATLVDDAFKTLLISLVGDTVYAAFVRDECDDWLDLWRDFEVKKKSIVPGKNCEKVNLRIPQSLVTTYEDIKKQKQKLSEAVNNSLYKGQIVLVRDKLSFQPNIMQDLFHESVTKTCEHLKSILQNERAKDVSAILMVGGFSESPMLQGAVRDRFPGLKVIIPVEASTAVLKGAVIFGHCPVSITHRVLRCTYGVKTTRPFKEGVNPDSKRKQTDDGLMCQDIFSKHVEINQVVKVGDAQVERRYSPIYNDQKFMKFPIFASKLKDPEYTDQNCTQVGTVRLGIPDLQGTLDDRGVLVSLSFGDTEVKVVAKDEKTGNRESVRLDFLN